MSTYSYVDRKIYCINYVNKRSIEIDGNDKRISMIV